MIRKVLVCGGRDFDDRPRLDAILDNATRFFEKRFCIIHGGARGADDLAGLWARLHGIPVILIPPNWGFYGKRAGMLRNEWMLNFTEPDLVIAFPGGRGTSGMIALAKKAGVVCYEV